MKRVLIYISIISGLFFLGYKLVTKTNLNPALSIGDVLDTFEGVSVYYNGGIDNVVGRNKTADGYNLGLKYQCVEFVKRFYYKRYSHKMPNSYGHAKDFYNPKIKDGQFNKGRGLVQHSNPSKTAPLVGSLVVYGPTTFNAYGHVSIISKVNLEKKFIEVIQQNSGQFGSTRDSFGLKYINGKWKIADSQIKGWLSPSSRRVAGSDSAK